MTYPDNNADNTEYPQPDTDYTEVIADSNAHALLASAIRIRGLEHFADTGMDPEFAELFLAKFATLVDNALMKFAHGQREHGGDIRQRPFRREKRSEMLDLICYEAAEDTLENTIAITL